MNIIDKLHSKLWIATRPKAIKNLIKQFPVACDVKIKPTGQKAFVYSYFEDGTLSVIVNEPPIPQYYVFGYKPEDLERILKETQ